MPSTYSPNKLYEEQGTGENNGTWGVLLNNVLSVIDLNFGGRLSKSVAGNSDVTISNTEARNVYHTLTGTLTGSISYIVPNVGSFYFIHNNTSGAFNVTVKPSGGTGIVVPQGKQMLLFSNPDTGAMVDCVSYLSSVSIGSITLTSPLGIGSGGTGQPTATAGFDALAPTTTRGDLIVRGASANGRLAIGSANTILGSDGTDAAWRTLSAAIDAALGSTRGSVLYRGASGWAILTPGTSGYVLTSQGAGADPTYAAGTAALASVSDYRTGTSTTAVIPVNVPWDAQAEVAISFSGTVTPAFASGNNFGFTATSNFTLANPTNPKVGQSGWIRVTQNGSGNNVISSWGGNYVSINGQKPVLSTAASAVDYINYIVRTTSRIEVWISRAVS